MRVEAKCKFCHKPVTLTIDDDYAATGDRFKLIQLCACNRCSDYYSARRLLFGKIKEQAMKLFSGYVKKDDKPKVREILTELVKRYMRLLSDFKRCPMPDWDESLVEGILGSPGNYSLVLAEIPKMMQQPTLV